MELYIDRGESEINDSILQEMIKEKDTLEKEMGTKLCWEERKRQNNRILKERRESGMMPP